MRRLASPSARLAAGLLLLAGVGGCEAPRPTDRWQPIHRLADRAAEARGTAIPAAAVGAVTRYVLSPVATATVGTSLTGSIEVPPSGELEVTFPCPADFAGRCTVARVSVATSERAVAEPVCCPRDAGDVTMRVRDLPPGPGFAPVTVLEGPPEPRWESAMLEMPAGAILEVALGIADPRAASVRAPARFRVTAVGEAGATVELLDRTLDPARNAADAAWVETRVPIDPARNALGPSLRLVFVAEGTAGDDRPALPVWGNPTVFATNAPPPERRRPSVILVSLDTLRADRLGCYGSRRRTPNVDRVAKDGVLFEHAMAPANSTLPSHASLFTGTYPCVHGLTMWDPSHLAPPSGLVPLAEVVRAAGYRTAAFTEDGVVDAAAFQRGFDVFEAHTMAEATPGRGLVERTLAEAERWLRVHHPEPFFLFLHTYEVHSPYDPPEPFRREALEAIDVPGPLAVVTDPRDPFAEPLYGGEVEYLDSVLGRLFALVEELGLRDRTVLILTSDHGEAFGEHGAYGHGSQLFAEQVRVPLVWRSPGRIGSGRRVKKPVSLVDVMPTVLELLGLPVPASVQGMSFGRFLALEELPALPEWAVFGEHGGVQLVVQWGQWKGFFRGGGFVGGYRLDIDPDETNRLLRGNLSQGLGAMRKKHLEDCAERLQRRKEADQAPVRPGGVPNPERERMLRELGYLQ